MPQKGDRRRAGSAPWLSLPGSRFHALYRTRGSRIARMRPGARFEAVIAFPAMRVGVRTAGDAIGEITYLFLRGPAPASPFPEIGLDPSDDVLDCAP